jgi:glutamyl-tRNA reductase
MVESINSDSFYVIGLSYKKADVSVRSKFSVDIQNQEKLLLEAKESDISGVIIISTCNRTEIFGFAKNPYQFISLLCKYSKGSIDEFAKVSYVYKNNEAIEHFINIATGLDSQILGDYEIVGQLKDSFQHAKRLGTVNNYLERLYNITLQASKEVKNKTSLSSGTTTVSYAAIQYIKDHYSDFNNLNILIYGLGKIGSSTAKSCTKYLKNSKITIINRTDTVAFNLAKEIAVQPKKHIDLDQELIKADVIIVATGASNTTIESLQFQNKKEQLIIDLSIPRNVALEVNQIDHKTLIDVDLLSQKTKTTIENRKKQIPMVEKIIKKHKKEFLDWLHFRKNTPAINSLKKSLENIQKDAIFLHSKKHHDFNPEQTEEVTSVIINKIVSKFAMHLKDNNQQVNQSIQMMKQVFKVDVEN